MKTWDEHGLDETGQISNLDDGACQKSESAQLIASGTKLSQKQVCLLAPEFIHFSAARPPVAMHKVWISPERAHRLHSTGILPGILPVNSLGPNPYSRRKECMGRMPVLLRFLTTAPQAWPTASGTERVGLSYRPRNSAAALAAPSRRSCRCNSRAVFCAEILQEIGMVSPRNRGGARLVK